MLAQAVFEANYSRKLSSLKHRVVPIPADCPLSEMHGGLMYWKWAFESPANVKIVVRRELGDENTPQVRTGGSLFHRSLSISMPVALLLLTLGALGRRVLSCSRSSGCHSSLFHCA